MKRRIFGIGALALTASLAPVASGAGDGEDMRANDPAAVLQAKLATALRDLPVDQLTAQLTRMGARQVSVDHPADDPAPITAIFGLRRPFPNPDTRVRIFVTVTPADLLGDVIGLEIYPK